MKRSTVCVSRLLGRLGLLSVNDFRLSRRTRAAGRSFLSCFKRVPVAKTTVAAAVLVISFSSTVGISRTEAADVLFLTGDLPGGPSDAFVANRLDVLGHSVTEILDVNSQSSDAAGKDLIIISNSVDSSAVNTKFTDVPVSLLTWENALYEELLMTNAGPPPTNVIGDKLFIVDAGHPLADGLPPGTSQILDIPDEISIGLGDIAPGAHVVATAMFGPSETRPSIFVIEPGAERIGGSPAPALRIGIFLRSPVAGDNYNSNAIALFDAAVGYAIIPEPSSLALTAFALVGLLAHGRHRRRD